MKAWDCRLLFAACLPLSLMACPTDPVPVEDDDSSGSSTMMVDPTTTTLTPDPTNPTPDPTTTTSDPTTSGGASSTGVADTGTSDSGLVTTGEISVCGNNVIEGDEACDLNQLNGETCASLGYQGGVLGCLLTCEDYNLLGCFICGNEVVDIAEDCEGEVQKGVTCESLGYEAGWIECGDDCLYDLSECSICGDGIQQGPEDCDGIDFGGETCQSIGFAGGNLGCNLAQCQFVYSGCMGGQYIQNFEGTGGVMPGEFTVSVAAPWYVDDVNPFDGVYSARSGALPGGGITDLTMVADFPAAGDISFDHLTSCDPNFDVLEFRIDNVLQQTWTGVPATSSNYMAPVAAGQHTFVWRFNRQAFNNAGLDAVLIDNIQLSGGVPL